MIGEIGPPQTAAPWGQQAIMVYISSVVSLWFQYERRNAYKTDRTRYVSRLVYGARLLTTNPADTELLAVGKYSTFPWSSLRRWLTLSVQHQPSFSAFVCPEMTRWIVYARWGSNRR